MSLCGSLLTLTFCRKCKKLRSCLDTNSISNYRYLCKSCSEEEDLLSSCRSCGREAIENDLKKSDGYCHLCINDNILECDLCGDEVYRHNTSDNICHNCAKGKNKPCNKCETYINSNKLTSDGLCEKCAIEIYKTLKKSKVNEIVECIECGREAYINDLKEGLCIYCYSECLEHEIFNLKNKNRKKSYY